GHADLIREAKSRGYEVRLVYIGVDSPETCIRRISVRVARGGHFIPDADVRRRYGRSLANCAKALRLVDNCRVYDNSGDGHRLVLVARAGVIVWRAEILPQ